MARVVLDAATTTALRRNTVHEYYAGKAFGFFVLNHFVPITLNVKQPAGHYERVVLVYERLKHQYTPYKDLGLLEKCCTKVLGFNIRHYVKCFLPGSIGTDGEPTEPYTWNLCQKCGVSVKDDHGHTIQYIAKRSYRRNKFIWHTDKSLQDGKGPGEIFSYQGELPCKD